MQRKKIDNVYPFTAIVGQEKMKEAIVLNLINPALGGVLIRGQKGTAKTTVVRAIPNLMRKLKIVEIPANATEDRVAGTINIEAALKDGEKKFEPGLLKEADGNILYVDEVNLLDDHIVDRCSGNGQKYSGAGRNLLYACVKVHIDRFDEPRGGKSSTTAA